MHSSQNRVSEQVQLPEQFGNVIIPTCTSNDFIQPNYIQTAPVPTGFSPAVPLLPAVPSVPLPLELEGRDKILENDLMQHQPQPLYFLDSQWYASSPAFLDPNQAYYVQDHQKTDPQFSNHQPVPSAPPPEQPYSGPQQEYYNQGYYEVAPIVPANNYMNSDGNQMIAPPQNEAQQLASHGNTHVEQQHIQNRQTLPPPSNPRTAYGSMPQPPNYDQSLLLPSHPPVQPPLPPPVTVVQVQIPEDNMETEENGSGLVAAEGKEVPPTKDSSKHTVSSEGQTHIKREQKAEVNGGGKENGSGGGNDIEEEKARLEKREKELQRQQEEFLRLSEDQKKLAQEQVIISYWYILYLF